jgi:hypothetical protein
VYLRLNEIRPPGERLPATEVLSPAGIAL